jgi:CubicO group peptidase (beta-lactamase class C family)
VWAVAGEEDAGQRFEKVVQPMVRAINAGDYGGISRDFDKVMLDALPLEKSTVFFKNLMRDCGKIVKLDAARVIPPNEAVFVAHFERAVLDIKVVLDKRDKIIGLWLSPQPPLEVCPVDGDHAVADVLKPIRQAYRVPAIAGVILTSKGVEDCGVVGIRKSGTGIPATVNDKWHLGSDTKAMTATLAGRLVERRLLKWDTTVADVFPNLATAFHPKTRGITVLQLLSHRAGLPKDLNWASISAQGTVQEQRVQAVKQGLADNPQSNPGDKYRYSNLGYVIVGAIIEKATGLSWERAIQDQVFKPLEMKSAGFGGTGTPGQIDQPWGHSVSGQPVPANGPSVDNPPVMAPAGCVHCTIQDWARFAADQLRGARGEPALLKTSTYQALYTPPYGGDYGLGWVVTKRDWGGGTVLTHSGCNTMNCAVVWIAPQKDFAVLVCINQGDDAALRASDDAVVELIKLHASKKERNRP